LLCIVAIAALVFTACGGGGSAETAGSSAAGGSSAAAEGGSAAGGDAADGALLRVAMVSDVGGVNDQSFNQSAWEGLQQLEADGIAEVTYLESQQESDYVSNLENLTDQDYQIIWGIGYMLADPILTAAKTNPDTTYAIVDNDYGDETPENVICLVFDSQDSSFLCGYIAGRMTETNNVGVVGGIQGDVIDTFVYGYSAGAKYAAYEQGKEIEVQVQYIDSFTDSAKGKTVATKMIQDGADVVFQACGGGGVGVIEAAKEQGKWAIGADSDQNHLAPDNVLTSAMKLVGAGMYNVCKESANGNDLRGQTYLGTLENGSVGIAPTSAANVPEDILADTEAVKQKLISGELTAPIHEEPYNEFLETLQ
jgi:basic membrane protein A